MKKVKYIVLFVLSLISVSCSNKGNGDKFYVEMPELIVHSTLKCEAIKGGVESREPGEYYGDLMCSKCMDDQLFEIAKYGKHKDKDEEEEDF